MAKWCSQPLLNRGMHAGDLLASAALLFSGNNFGKLALFSQLLKLHFVSSSAYHRIQRFYLVPAVDKAWKIEQDSLIQSLRGKDIMVSGKMIDSFFIIVHTINGFQCHFIMHVSEVKH